MWGLGSAVYQYHKAITLSIKQPMVLFLWGAQSILPALQFWELPLASGIRTKKKSDKERKKGRNMRRSRSVQSLCCFGRLLQLCVKFIGEKHEWKITTAGDNAGRSLQGASHGSSWNCGILFVISMQYNFDADCKLPWELNWGTFSIIWLVSVLHNPGITVITCSPSLPPRVAETRKWVPYFLMRFSLICCRVGRRPNNRRLRRNSGAKGNGALRKSLFSVARLFTFQWLNSLQSRIH